MNVVVGIPRCPVVDCRKVNTCLIQNVCDVLTLCDLMRQFWAVINAYEVVVRIQTDYPKCCNGHRSPTDIDDLHDRQSHSVVSRIIHYHVSTHGDPDFNPVTQKLLHDGNRGQHGTVDSDDRSGAGW